MALFDEFTNLYSLSKTLIIVTQIQIAHFYFLLDTFYLRLQGDALEARFGFEYIPRIKSGITDVLLDSLRSLEE